MWEEKRYACHFLGVLLILDAIYIANLSTIIKDLKIKMTPEFLTSIQNLYQVRFWFPILCSWLADTTERAHSPPAPIEHIRTAQIPTLWRCRTIEDHHRANPRAESQYCSDPSVGYDVVSLSTISIFSRPFLPCANGKTQLLNCWLLPRDLLLLRFVEENSIQGSPIVPLRKKEQQ